MVSARLETAPTGLCNEGGDEKIEERTSEWKTVIRRLERLLDKAEAVIDGNDIASADSLRRRAA